jgi:regulator of nucleoside diphosphate kinase
MAAILMTHTDHQRLRDVLDRMTTEDRRHFAALSRTVQGALRMDPTELPPDVVTMDSVVSLDEFGTGDHWVLTLSYPWDANIDENRISVLSPVGTAILGRRVGDVVNWIAPQGVVRARIDRLLSQPEAIAFSSGRASTASQAVPA